MNLDKKKSHIAQKIRLLDTFNKNNPEIDLRSTNFSEDTGSGKLNWKDISATDKPKVRKQLMAFQRVLNLGEDTAVREILLSKGYDSAMTIIDKNRGEFVKASGLEIGKEQKEEQNEEVIQGGAEAIGSRVEEEAQEKISEQKEEEKKVKQPKKKKAPKSKRKEGEFGVASISKHVEKQTNYLERLEQVLEPLRKLAKGLDVQSKVIKEINTSIKQLQRQIMEIQKAIQKGKMVVKKKKSSKKKK